MSESRRGRPMPKSHYLMLSRLFRGRAVSLEQRRKLSEAAKGKVPWNKGKKFPQFSGSNSIFWKGEKASRDAMHRWIVRQKGRPRKCEHCGSTGKLHWANVSGQYYRDPDDFIGLCPLCHRRYDMKMGINLPRKDPTTGRFLPRR